MKEILNKIKKSVEQDFAQNKATLVLALCMPLLVLQYSPTDLFDEVLWWLSLVILSTTILYIIFAVYLKFTKK